MTDKNDTSQALRTALNVAAIYLVEAAQQVNQAPGQVQPARILKGLAEASRQIRVARQEIGKRPGPPVEGS